MSTIEASLVAIINTNSNRYRITDRDGILIGGRTFENIVVSWGDVEKIGNLMDFETTTGDLLPISLQNGEEMLGGGYNIAVNDNWNNSEIIIKRYKDGDMVWADCDNYARGIIKEFNVQGDMINFSVDLRDYRDDTLIPGVVTTDQSEDTNKSDTFKATSRDDKIEVSNEYFSVGELAYIENDEGVGEYVRIKSISGTEYIFYNDVVNSYSTVSFVNTIRKPFVNIPKNFVDKTLPIQIGGLFDYDDGLFAKTLTADSSIANKKIFVDYVPLYDIENIGVWDNGLERYFKALASRTKTSTILTSVGSGESTIRVKHPGLFNKGDRIILNNGSNKRARIIHSMQDTNHTDGDDGHVKYLINLTSNLDITFGVGSTVTVEDGEFDINDNHISFNKSDLLFLKSGTTLNNTDDISTLYFEAWEMVKIPYFNEDNDKTENSKDLICQTVLMIDNELMLVIQQPDYDNGIIYVERGYLGTEKTTHNANSTLYVAATYGGKNLLLFHERFEPNNAANIYFETDPTLQTSPGGYAVTQYNQSILDAINQNGDVGKFSNAFNGNDSTYFQYENGFLSIRNLYGGGYNLYYSFNLQFDNIETDANVVKVYNGSKIDCKLINQEGATYYNYILLSTSSNYNTSFIDAEPNCYYLHRVNWYYAGSKSDKTMYSIDFNNSVQSDYYGQYPQKGFVDSNNDFDGITTLKDLNDMPRLHINQGVTTRSISYPDPSSFYFENKIYNIGLWLDFTINFTKQNVMASIIGRKITDEVEDITGTTAGGLAGNPVDVLALLLTQELGYEKTEFTSSWQTIRDSVTQNQVATAFSYGLEDKQETGWEFCQWLASHFNLQIVKTDDGIIDLISMAMIYKDYVDPIANVNVDEINFIKGSGQRDIKLMQTGDELLYNDFKIKHTRNNSTDEYQAVYVLPDDATLLSGKTIAEARDAFYNGKKRTLEIESPFIVDEDEAFGLANILADDQAEPHFLFDFSVPFDLWEDKSMTEQFKIGDIITFTGRTNGLNLTTDREFYIQNLYYRESGDKLQVEAKSLEAITEFEV